MYTTKVYRALGGDEIVVESGGKITLKAGSTLENAGDFFTSVTFDTDDFTVALGAVSLKTVLTYDSDYFTVSDGEVTIKTEVAALLTIVGNIPTSDPAVSGQVWNDTGVLKVSAGE